MFERRYKPGFLQRAMDFFWPRSGWKRASKYVFHRVARLPGTPYSLAAGFACGAAISFTPFVGLHFVLAAILAWIMRANVIASAIGTAVGNPWTFPFIWVWIYKSGLWMTLVEGEDVAALNFHQIFADMSEAAYRLDVGYLLDTVWPIFWPMFVGSLPTGILVWLVFYGALRPVIGSYKGRRARRRAGLE